MTLERNEHTHLVRQKLKCKIFWARLVRFGQPDLISDPHITFQKSWNGLNDYKYKLKCAVDDAPSQISALVANVAYSMTDGRMDGFALAHPYHEERS